MCVCVLGGYQLGVKSCLLLLSHLLLVFILVLSSKPYVVTKRINLTELTRKIIIIIIIIIMIITIIIIIVIIMMMIVIM